MPGVLILEGMAQVGAVMAYLGMDDSANDQLVYFAGMDKVRFRQRVGPGDQLILETRTLKRKLRIWTLEAKAYVDEKLVAEAQLLATFR